MAKRALITGITGQDGSYLAEFLLEKGYEVHGLVRRTSRFNRARIDPLMLSAESASYPGKLQLHYGDLLDRGSIRRVLEETNPHEVYNLAAQSHVKISFEMPEYTSDVTGMGTLRILEALKDLKSEARFFQAGSSEMFGKVKESPQSEETPFYPRSPYACAKVYSHWVATNYREAHGLFICNGICFNHESPRRGENFVTRKITLGVAAIKKGEQDKLILGNLDSRRDWGYAKDYVQAMWLMLQQDQPDDYVVATGQSHSVRDFCEKAFSSQGLNYQDYVESHEKYFRPTEVDSLVGDFSKAKEKLGWEPTTQFDELVKIMVDADLKGYAI